MSDLDEETKRILAEVETDAQSGPNDSKDNNKKKKFNSDAYQEYDINDDKDADDTEW